MAVAESSAALVVSVGGDLSEQVGHVFGEFVYVSVLPRQWSQPGPAPLDD